MDERRAEKADEGAVLGRPAGRGRLLGTPGGGGRPWWLVVGVCCSAVFVSTLDATAVSVALPTLQAELHASEEYLQWVVTGYVLVRASLLLVAGALGDRFGRRGCFRAGLCVFMVGSLACAGAPDAAVLVAARCFQGVGGALMTPSSLAILMGSVDSPAQRARALGLWSATTGISTAAGPVLGGAMVVGLGWRSIFLINAPVVALGLAGTRRVSNGARARRPRPFDVPGQVTVVVALSSLTFGLIEAPVLGWSSPGLLSLVGLSAVAGAAFIARERRAHHPLVALDLLGRPALAGALAAAVIGYISLGGFLFFNTLYLQGVRGLSPLLAGLLTLPTTGAVIFVAPVSGRLLARAGARAPAALGVLLAGSGLGELAVCLGRATSVAELAAGYCLLGAGIGLLNPPVTSTAVSNMPPDRAGVAAALTSTARQVGTMLGVAALGSVVFSVMAGRGALGHTVLSLRSHPLAAGAFVSGLRLGYGATAAVGLTMSLCALWALDPVRSRPVRLPHYHPAQQE